MKVCHDFAPIDGPELNIVSSPTSVVTPELCGSSSRKDRLPVSREILEGSYVSYPQAAKEARQSYFSNLFALNTQNPGALCWAINSVLLASEWRLPQRNVTNFFPSTTDMILHLCQGASAAAVELSCLALSSSSHHIYRKIIHRCLHFGHHPTLTDFWRRWTPIHTAYILLPSTLCLPVLERVCLASSHLHPLGTEAAGLLKVVELQPRVFVPCSSEALAVAPQRLVPGGILPPLIECLDLQVPACCHCHHGACSSWEQLVSVECRRVLPL